MDLSEAEEIKKSWQEYTEELCKKAKWLSEEALTNSCEKKRSKKQRSKGKIYPFACRVPKNSKKT